MFWNVAVCKINNSHASQATPATLLFAIWICLLKNRHRFMNQGESEQFLPSKQWTPESSGHKPHRCGGFVSCPSTSHGSTLEHLASCCLLSQRHHVSRLRERLRPARTHPPHDVIHWHETCLWTADADYFGGVQVDRSMSSKSDNNIWLIRILYVN